MTQQNIFFHDDLDAQAQNLSNLISALLIEDIKEKGTALLVLPGGSSPRTLIGKLAQESLPWNKIQITATDERCVPLENVHSNVGQIKKLFAEQEVDITPMALWDENKKSRMDASLINFPATVTVLGMGGDGHIASLFPEQNWSNGNDLIIDALSPAEPCLRISLTMDTLASSKHIILLVNSDDKLSVFQRIKQEQYTQTPLARFLTLTNCRLHVHVVT